MRRRNRILMLVLALAAAWVSHARAAEEHAQTLPPFSIQAVTDSIAYKIYETSNNQVGVTLTNYGFMGNNFTSRKPSLEYPLGTGYEHMVRGGLWIGAHAIDDFGPFIGVTTATVDGSQGGATASATEYTPATNDFRYRSTLPKNPAYRPGVHAVSEQDVISLYSDVPSKRSDNNSENHRPMHLLVRQENYMWSFADFQHAVVFHYVITNNGPPLKNLWVGLYSELASGPKNSYSSWPPSGAFSTIGGWYSKKLLAYEDSLRLFREHYCFGLPVPNGCIFERVPEWIGIKVLGVKPGNLADTSDKKVTLSAWRYSPGSSLRDQDIERYPLMSAGTISTLQGDSLQPQSGDPVELNSVGPFAEVDPGDSVSVDFAIVGGAQPSEIERHARVIQHAFDLDYVVPVPPPSPSLHVVARQNALDLYWDDAPEFFEDPTSPLPRDFEGYRVYIGEDLPGVESSRVDLHRIAEFDLVDPPHDTTGFNTGMSAVRLATPAVFDGVTYHYRYTIPSLRDGFKYFVAVTSYDLGNREIESLESGTTQNNTLAIPGAAPGEVPGGPIVFPNPYRVEARWDQGSNVRDHYLWFTRLPERCTLKIFTLSGDLVFETDFDGRTYHGEGARGVYDPNREIDVSPPTLSGTTYAWNLITKRGQAAATGLYLYSVEDKATGKRTVSKFLIVKSDRENF
ncbi:MAG: hypothetical protein HYR73_06635 [Candidatus Eisenbacteria bacterium]|nr:hypothetical protein [Candidatus Eisenbacteria bacterium]